MIELDGYVLDDIVSNINPKVMKIGLNKNRALDGTLWVEYTTTKRSFELIFEDITQEQRDTLLSKFTMVSSFGFKYIDGIVYNVHFVDDTWQESLISDDYGNIFFTISFNLEEI